MLWIIIWVSSVIIMLAIWKWAQNWVTQRIQQMWTNLLVIIPWNPSSTNVRTALFWRWGWWNAWDIPTDDIDIIKQNINSVEYLSPENSWRKQLIHLANNMSSTITWIMPEYQDTRNFKVNLWRFIDQEDVKTSARVAAIWVWVAKTLFPWIDPIWEDIRIQNTILTVVWVMEEKGSSQDDLVLIPITTAQQRIFWKNTIQSLYLKIKEGEDMTSVQKSIENLLMRKHNIKNKDESDFTVINQAEIIWTMNQVTWIFTLLLWGIWSISLIVGWIWVMNIMLVSVTERTKEIWIRKAIWAKNRDILYQFLSESVLLSLIGWLIWLAISFSIYWIMTKFVTSFPLIMTSSSVILSLVFSVSVWIIFGILPAIKASKLNPIDALRYE